MYVIHPEGIEKGVMRLSDCAWIPASKDNRDWQKYLAWVAEGNQPTLPDLRVSDRVRVVEQLKQDALSKSWDELAPIQRKIVLGQDVTDAELGIEE